MGDHALLNALDKSAILEKEWTGSPGLAAPSLDLSAAEATTNVN